MRESLPSLIIATADSVTADYVTMVVKVISGAAVGTKSSTCD